MRSKLLRTKGSLGTFVADANPNTTPPSSADVAALPTLAFPSAGNVGVRKILLSPVFADGGAAEVPTATMTGVVWLRDENDSKWFKVGTFTALLHRENVVISNVSEGTVYIQITTLPTPATATTVDVKAIPVAEAS